ncbi:MAG: ZIP family zinc transporter [Xanthobacteraceae bacterium]
MPLYIQALLWGLLSGSALVIGATLAFVPHISARMLAAVTAFGAGVLISALSFELIDEAHERGGLWVTALGFLAGAGIFTAANLWINRAGGHGRSRSGHHQMHAHEGGGLAIAVGALIDGIPESIAIGVSLLAGKGTTLVAVAAIFLANLPEGLASATGMRKAGRTNSYIFGVWGGIALACGLAAMLGNLTLAQSDPMIIAIVLAVAAGAILALIVDTMIPEAFEVTHEYAGLITVLGFLTAFALSKGMG